MSRTLRKAVENAKQKKETEINLADEGIAHLEEVPELCESGIRILALWLIQSISAVILHNLTKLVLSHNKIGGMYDVKLYNFTRWPPYTVTTVESSAVESSAV